MKIVLNSIDYNGSVVDGPGIRISALCSGL